MGANTSVTAKTASEHCKSEVCDSQIVTHSELRNIIAVVADRSWTKGTKRIPLGRAPPKPTKVAGLSNFVDNMSPQFRERLNRKMFRILNRKREWEGMENLRSSDFLYEIADAYCFEMASGSNDSFEKRKFPRNSAVPDCLRGKVQAAYFLTPVPEMPNATSMCWRAMDVSKMAAAKNPGALFRCRQYRAGVSCRYSNGYMHVAIAVL